MEIILIAVIAVAFLINAFSPVYEDRTNDIQEPYESEEEWARRVSTETTREK